MALKDKVVIVSGASRGIGQAIVQTLSAAGAIVFGIARSDPATIPSNDRTQYLQVDIRSSEHVTAAVSKIRAAIPRIDILVNNAGIEYFLPVEDMDETRFNETLETNLRGAFLLTQAVLPVFRSQREGHLLFINSVSGLRGFGQDSVYCASKWGLAGFADALEEELRPTGVRVTSLFPGATDTDLPSSSWSPKDDPRRPFFLSPEDVARAALFALDQPAHVAISRIVLRPMIEPPYSDFLPLPSRAEPNAESPGPSAA
jgi:NAD(P)-dependent dehydrogenase (short-subunit alcohol dehydrogenase family)